MAVRFAVLLTAAFLGMASADEIAVKYADMGEAAKQQRERKLSEMEHTVTTLAKERQPFNPKVLINFLKKHPKQAEIVASLLATGVVIHETKVIPQVVGMLRGSRTAAVPIEEPVETTPDVLETPEAAEEAEEAAMAQSEPEVAKETTAIIPDVVVGADVANGSEDVEELVHEDEHDSHHLAEPMTWKDVQQAMMKPVNITKMIVFLASLVIFLALRRHAQQKASKHLMKAKSIATPVAHVVGLDSTGGASSTPRV